MEAEELDDQEPHAPVSVAHERPARGPSGLIRLDSIKSRIVALALLATLVPALSTAVLSYVQNRQALTETLEGELRSLGSQTARELDLWIRERTNDVRVFVGSFEVSENLDRIETGGPGSEEALTRLTDYLTGVQSRFSDYEELLVLDAEDFGAASSSETIRETPLPPDWRARLRQGETVLGEPVVDPTGGVVVRIGQPIESTQGRYLGTLVATLTFDAVRDILADFAPGDGGRMDLVTADGLTIAASAETAALERTVPQGTLAELSAAGGGTIEYTGPEGASVVGARTEVPRLDWAVVTQVPSGEAFAQVRQLRNTTVVLVSFLLVFVGLVAYFLGFFIVRPLDRLTEGAGAVAAGDLSVDLRVTGGGEVAYLTEVFNGMVMRLRESRAELALANAALREQNVELERISMTDALTGLYNRRYLINEFEKELQRASRHDRPMSVLMIDVDRFKQYNDSYGHQAGDEVLTAIGLVMRDATRDPDVPARYGGEEFIVLLPDCDIDGAVMAAERIRGRLAEEVFEGGKVTCSIGAAAFPSHGDAVADLIAAADAALYQAKETGRDRVMRAEQGSKVPKTNESTEAKRRSPAKKKEAVKKELVARKTAASERGSMPKKKAPTTKGAAPKKNAAAKKKKAGATKGVAPKKKAPKKSP